MNSNIKLLQEKQAQFDSTANRFSKPAQLISVEVEEHEEEHEEEEDEEEEEEEEEEYNRLCEEANKNLLGSAEEFKQSSLQKKELKKQLAILQNKISNKGKTLEHYMVHNKIPFFDEKSSNNKIVLVSKEKIKPLSKLEVKKRFEALFGLQNGPLYYKTIFEENRQKIEVTKVLYKTEDEIRKEDRKRNKHLQLTQKYDKFLQAISDTQFDTTGFDTEEKNKLKNQLLKALNNIK